MLGLGPLGGYPLKLRCDFWIRELARIPSVRERALRKSSERAGWSRQPWWRSPVKLQRDCQGAWGGICMISHLCSMATVLKQDAAARWRALPRQEQAEYCTRASAARAASERTPHAFARPESSSTLSRNRRWQGRRVARQGSCSEAYRHEANSCNILRSHGASV